MPRAGLTRDSIAAAALALLDEVGVEGFSMRTLARRLGVDPMAAYRHVRNQQEVFDAVAERMLAELDLVHLPWPGGWQALAEGYCLRLREVLVQHPHCVTIFATRPVRSPESIDQGVRMLEVLVAEGFSPADALRLSRALREFTIGHVLGVVAADLGADSPSRKPAPGDPDYNLLAEAADATSIHDHFEMAVSALLAGFERFRGRDTES